MRVFVNCLTQVGLKNGCGAASSMGYAPQKEKYCPACEIFAEPETIEGYMLFQNGQPCYRDMEKRQLSSDGEEIHHQENQRFSEN